MRRQLGMIMAIAAGWSGPVAAQSAPAPPAVPLLERLVGRWTLTGQVRGKPAGYRLDADWMLQHRYVQLHMTDVRHTPAQYEARVFIYPAGAFHDSFLYDSKKDAWTIRLDAADGKGGWKRFAEYQARRG